MEPYYNGHNLILMHCWTNISQLITESEHNAIGNCSNSLNKIDHFNKTMVPWQAVGRTELEH
jgi:hypothetical protein